jgi:hypothetical protein
MSPYVYRFADEQRAFGLSEYLLLVPHDVALTVDGNFEGLEREEWDHGGLRAIRWRNRDVPPLRREPYAPPAQELLPWVSYSFGVSWQDVGDTMRDRVLPVLRSSPELREWATARLADSDPARAVRALVDGVCDEVAAGRRALTLGTTAGVSFSRRDGNRLAIVAAALVDAGWDVDLVMARPQLLAGNHLEVPTLETFSEPLLRVRRAGREVWVDLEDQRRGVDSIRPILQGGDGLVLPLTHPADPVTLLERLPEFESRELEQRVSVNATVQASGDARIAFAMELEGPEAEQLLERVTAAPADRVQMVYQQMANNLFPGASAVTGKLDREADRTTLRLELELPGACDVTGDRMECRGLVVSRPLVPSLASLPERSYPLVVPLPITERVELILEAPPGWSMDRAPRRLEAEWGSVVEQLTVDGSRIRSLLTLGVGSLTVEPRDYPRFARLPGVDEPAARPAAAGSVPVPAPAPSPASAPGGACLSERAPRRESKAPVPCRARVAARHPAVLLGDGDGDGDETETEVGAGAGDRERNGRDGDGRGRAGAVRDGDAGSSLAAHRPAVRPPARYTDGSWIWLTGLSSPCTDRW